MCRLSTHINIYIYYIYVYVHIIYATGTLRVGGSNGALSAEVRGRSREEQPHTQGQGRWPGGPTPPLRSGGCSGAGGPRGAIPRWRSGRAAVRRYPLSKVRSSGCTLLEQLWKNPTPNVRDPSKTVGVAREHQRANTLKTYSQKTSQCNHTRKTVLSNSMKLGHARGATQDGWVMLERSDRMWSTGEGNGKPLQYSCLENPMNSMKRQNDRILKK